jgi:epsilon-lactone hydrolase
MIDKLGLTPIFCIYVASILFLVVLLPGAPLLQDYSYAQNSSIDDSSHIESEFFITSTISDEAKQILKNVTSNPWPEFKYPESNDTEGWKNLSQQAESMSISQSLPILNKLRPNISSFDIGNISAFDVKPMNWTDNGKVLVYTHGGGYTLLSANSTLSTAATIANATGLRVISVDYSLAPASKWNQTTSEVVSIIKDLIEEQGYEMKDIAMFGDSAGGGLVAGSVLKLRDEGTGIPSVVVLWSPWTDVTLNGDTYITLNNSDLFISGDIMLQNMAGAYAHPSDHRNPYVSPVYGNFSQGFAPTLIQVGTKEILLSDSVRLYQALDQAGIPVKLDVYEGMPHVFQYTLYPAPESELAIQKTADFILDYINS